MLGSMHPACPAFARYERINDESQVQPPSFHPFARLPSELRNQIWHTAANRRRLVGNGFCQPSWKSPISCHRLWDRPPAIAHVCRESRAIALGYGKLQCLVILDEPWGLGGRIVHRTWGGKRDIWLWPNFASLNHDRGYEIWSVMKPLVRELLVPLAVDRNCWRGMFDALVHRLAFSDKGKVRTIDLFVPADLCGELNLKKEARLPSSDLFGDDDVRMIELLKTQDIADFKRKYLEDLPRQSRFYNTNKTRKCAVERARDMFLVPEAGTEVSLLQEISSRLVARWLWEKWHNEVRRSRLPFSYKRVENMAAWDHKRWDLQHPWCKNHLASLPKIRPVYVVAKDASWHRRDQKTKKKKPSVRKASKSKCWSWLQKLWRVVTGRGGK